MRFVWMMVLTLGCETKDPYADGDTAGSYSGAGDPGEDTPETTADSCVLDVVDDYCIEPNEPDNEAWCTGLPDNYGATYRPGPCPNDYVGMCAIPSGGDFSARATGYYYADFSDPRAACESMGGTFTDSSG